MPLIDKVCQALTQAQGTHWMKTDVIQWNAAGELTVDCHMPNVKLLFTRATNLGGTYTAHCFKYYP